MGRAVKTSSSCFGMSSGSSGSRSGDVKDERRLEYGWSGVGKVVSMYNISAVVGGILNTYQQNPTAWNWRGRAGFYYVCLHSNDGSDRRLIRFSLAPAC